MKKRIKKIITVILAIAGTAAFGQFIIEESLQNLGFGASMLIMNKLYRNSLDNAKYVQSAVDQYQSFHNSCQKVMTVLYIGNPVTAIWFHKYMLSDQVKLNHYKKLLKEEIYYLTTKQERQEKTTRERYISKKDKEHINEILPIKR